MERTNEEIRRRERVIRIFPNRQSCERLLGALLMEFDEQMGCGKIYVGMDEYLTWRTARSAVQMSEPRCADGPETQMPHRQNHHRKEDELAA